MKSINKKILILMAIIILVVLGVSKLIITPSKIGIITLDKVINENISVYGISKGDMNKILKFYKSISDMNLPYPKLEYGKQIKLSNLVYQQITIKEHPKDRVGNYQITFEFDFDKYSEESYNNGEGYTMKDMFKGIIYFKIEKIGFNKWKIVQVKTSKMSPFDKDGHWSSEYE